MSLRELSGQKKFPPEESGGISLTLKTTNMKILLILFTITYTVNWKRWFYKIIPVQDQAPAAWFLHNLL